MSIPTLTLQAIQPTLAAAATRLRDGGLEHLAGCSQALLAAGRPDLLTHLFLTQGIEPSPETLSQLFWVQGMFSGRFPKPEINARLNAVPALSGDRLIDHILNSHLPANITRQELATLGGSPFFRGDFTRILTLIARLPHERPGPSRVLRYWEALESALAIEPELAPRGIFLLAPESFPIPPGTSLTLFVRLFAQRLFDTDDIACKHRLIGAFGAAYHHADTRFGTAFAAMTPAILSDPRSESAFLSVCLRALRKAQTEGPSEALRRAAARALETIAKERAESSA